MEFNCALIGERGGNLCGEDRFTIEACAECQGQYLFNRVLNDVYYDPDDLTRRYFRIPGLTLPPCRYCGAIALQFSDTAPDRAAAQTGPWAWTLQSRQFSFAPPLPDSY